MLSIIKDPESMYLSYVKDDPVRPELPPSFRIENNKFIGALVEDSIKPLAMICVAILDAVPKTVEDLFEDHGEKVAVFYTVWSYAPGAGAKIVFNIVDYIKENFPTVTRFVTLSPKTEMARKFHLKNGAFELSDNELTVNYEYKV